MTIQLTLITVFVIYCFKKYQAKRKRLLLFHNSNQMLKKFDINNVLTYYEKWLVMTN